MNHPARIAGSDLAAAWGWLLPAALVCVLALGTAGASDATWQGGTGTQDWATGTNWSTGSAPGATSGTTNPDVATFNTATAGTAITIDAGRNIKSLLFGNAVAGNFTIGSAGANGGETLLLSSGGTILVNLGFLAPVIINAPLVIQPTSASGTGTYTFENNATNQGTGDANPYKMTINGNISGGLTTSTITLNFKGTTGNRSNDATANVVNGLISDGQSAGVSVNITASGQQGVWRLNNDNNSYTGNTTATNGTLLFTSIADTGVNSSVGAGSSLTVGSGSFVKYLGGVASTNRTISGNGSFYNSGSGALTLTGSVNTGLIFRGAQNFVIDGLVTGTSGLTRTDGGTVFLNNPNNSFTGNLSISDGAFRAVSISNNGTNSSIGSNGQIRLGQNSTTVGRFEYSGLSTSVDRLIALSTSTGVGSSGRGKIDILTAGQTLTFTAGVRALTTMNAGHTSDLDLSGSGNGVISGQIGGTTSSASAVTGIQVKKTGTGTWTLSGANTYARETTVTAGILNIQHSTALGAILSNESTPTSAGAGTTVASGATLQLQNNINVGAEALSLAGTGVSGQTGALVNVSGTNSFAGALTLTGNTTIASDSGRLNLTHAADVVGSGGSRALTLSGTGDGSLAGGLTAANISSLTKNGSGLWTLSGTNSYTGTTTVNAGTLNVTGSLGNTAVSVANGATFAHAGSLLNNLTLADGAALMIGNAETAGSTGTLTVEGTLTLNNSSVLSFDLGPASDLIQANGALTLDGVVHVTPGAGFAAATYKLIDYAGALTNNGLTAQAIAGYDLGIAVDTGNTDVNLTATALSAQYWDGTQTTANSVMDGGDGIWTNTVTNWTSSDGSANAGWSTAAEKIAIFAAAAGGTVQVQDPVTVNGLQFAQNYALTGSGGQLQLAHAATEVRVNPSVTASLSAAITGTGGLNKTGDGILAISAAAGQNTYTGSTLVSSGTLKIGANNTLPTGGMLVAGSGTLTGNLDLTTASQQVASFQVASNQALTDNVIAIGSGQTLSVNGTGSVNIGVANSAKIQTRAVFNGGGALVVNNAAGNFEIGLQTATSLVAGMDSPFDNTANTNKTTVDFSGLGSFSATVNEFRIGYGLNNNATATLSNKSNTVTANVIQVAHSNNWNAGNGNTNLILGAGTNLFQTDTLNLGVSKGVATLKFASQTAGSAGSVIIGGKTGAAANLIIGSNNGTGTGATASGTLDLRGHDSTVTAATVSLGIGSNSGTGGATGILYFDRGGFTVDNLNLGFKSLNGGGTGAGTLHLSGGSFTVNPGGSIVLARNTNTTATGTATGTLNLTGGIFTSHVDITKGGGNGTTTATLNLSGGALDMTGHSIGNSTTPINTFTLASGTLKNLAEFNGGALVTKTTSGTLNLTGNNTYTGGTAIAAGTVTALRASALGTGSVTVASGARLNYAATADAALSLGGNLAVTSGTGTALGGSIGSTPSAAQIAVAGDATATVGAIAVNIFGISGISPAAGTNLYTLIHGAGAGSSLDLATYSLGTVYNNTNFTVGSLSKTATDLQIGITQTSPLAIVYWKGGLTGATNVWAASDGSTKSNWVSAATGGDTPLVPGAGADVSISANTVTTTPAATTLGADMSIKSLTIADTSNGLGLNADGHALTIGSGGLTMKLHVPSSTIAADVVLGGNQVWTNHSTSLLTVSGPVSGSGALTKAGTGTLVLSGANTFTGEVDIQNGTVALTGSLNPATPLNLGNAANSGKLVLGGTSGPVNQTVAGLTTTGSGTSNAVTGGNASNSTLTVNLASGAHTFAGSLGGAGTNEKNLSVTKAGTGTLTLSGSNPYAGTTTVHDGILKLLGTANGNSTIATDGDSATTDIVVAGGALEIAESEQIGNNAGIVLNSGALHFGSATGKTETIGFFTNNGGNFSTGANTLIGTGSTITFASGSVNTINSGGLLQDAHVVITGGTNTVEGSGTLQVTTGGTGLEMTGGNLTLNSDGSVAGRLLLQGNLSSQPSLTAATITSAGNAANPGTVDLSGGIRTITTSDGSAAVDLSISALLTNGGVAKEGTGTLELTGSNAYTGGTSVHAGTLLANNTSGSATGSGSVTVSGGTLGGHGTIEGATAIAAGGTLTAGTAGTTGTLTFSGGLTLASGATWLLDIQGGLTDLINITGSLDITGATLSLAAINPSQASYIIAARTGAGSLTGTFAGLANGAQVESSGYAIHYVGDAIILQAIPEPEVWLPALFVVALGLLRRGRRQPRMIA